MSIYKNLVSFLIGDLVKKYSKTGVPPVYKNFKWRLDMKRVYLLTLIIFIVSIFIVSNISSFAEESGEEMVKCAYDGMEMSKSSMKAKMKYQGNMYYFCTKEE